MVHGIWSRSCFATTPMIVSLWRASSIIRGCEPIPTDFFLQPVPPRSPEPSRQSSFPPLRDVFICPEPARSRITAKRSTRPLFWLIIFYIHQIPVHCFDRLEAIFFKYVKSVFSFVSLFFIIKTKILQSVSFFFFTIIISQTLVIIFTYCVMFFDFCVHVIEAVLKDVFHQSTAFRMKVCSLVGKDECTTWAWKYVLATPLFYFIFSKF